MTNVGGYGGTYPTAPNRSASGPAGSPRQARHAEQPDLNREVRASGAPNRPPGSSPPATRTAWPPPVGDPGLSLASSRSGPRASPLPLARSEEHTSELQSP